MRESLRKAGLCLEKATTDIQGCHGYRGLVTRPDRHTKIIRRVKFIYACGIHHKRGIERHCLTRDKHLQIQCKHAPTRRIISYLFILTQQDSKQTKGTKQTKQALGTDQCYTIHSINNYKRELENVPST